MRFIINILNGSFLLSILIFIGKLIIPSTNKRFYIKEYLHLTIYRISKIKLIIQITLQTICYAIIFFIILNNFAPFGLRYTYSLNDEKSVITNIVSKNRVRVINLSNDKIYQQINDIIYFNTKMPFKFDQAFVKLIYIPSSVNQSIELGYKDNYIWHYHTALIYSDILSKITWQSIGSGPYLYQRKVTYPTVDAFIKNPPKNAIIGTYNFDISTLPNFITTLPNYQPSKNETVIDTPLRGKHVMYVYLKNEPFKMDILKQDLNWYDGDDTVTVSIYKESTLVMQDTIPDDGTTTASRQLGPIQELSMENPGPGLPESGVYKIVIDASNDVLIKRITTNIHKIVFEGSLSLANNSTYTGTNNTPTILYTNALALIAQTYHQSGVQEISVDGQPLDIKDVQNQYSLIPKNDISEVRIQKGDVILQGVLGYFAFSKDQFFQPTPYRILPITRPEDIDLVDYILTDYQPPLQVGDWSVATQEFDLKDAYVQDGELSWVIEAPGLKMNNSSILIKDIQLTLIKDPWIHLPGK